MFRYAMTLAAAVGLAGLGTALAATPRPATTIAAPSPLQHTFLVFFEEDKAGLTPEGREILQTAARAAKGMGPVQVAVMVPSNQDGLAEARARALRAELVRDGVKPRAIANAGQPQDIAYANADPIVRAWLDRRAVVVVSPAPDAGSGPQARLINDILR
jgi:outer membrane protein OmpA-like peptidoglycan-associated protein